MLKQIVICLKIKKMKYLPYINYVLCLFLGMLLKTNKSEKL